MVPAVAYLATASCYATTYFSIEQVQGEIFPGASFTPVSLTLSAEQKARIEKLATSRVRNSKPKIWKAEKAGKDFGYLFLDEVIGKHEFITYAVGIDLAGDVMQVEIMDYRETYGFEVRNAAWRKQFVGKSAASPTALNQDIKNITGATLSCKHVTEGVKRILALHTVCLKR